MNAIAISANVPGYLQSASEEWGENKARVLKDTICSELSPPEFSLFVEVCRAKKLDPFSRQIHAVMRWNSQARKKTMTIQTGIDGFRALAERTGKYAGQRGPFWCGDDGVWKDVWLSADPPSAAKVEVLRTDFSEPLVGVALFKEFSQSGQNGLNPMWRKLGSVMIAKCAESVALRRGFPEELSGLYTDDEMRQAEEEHKQKHNVEETNRALEPVENKTIQVDTVDAEYEHSEVKAGESRAQGASSSKALLSYATALDSCQDLDDVGVTVTAWQDRLEKLPRGKEYVDAWEEHTRARVSDDHTIDASKVKYVDALRAMRDAVETHSSSEGGS